MNSDASFSSPLKPGLMTVFKVAATWFMNDRFLERMHHERLRTLKKTYIQAGADVGVYRMSKSRDEAARMGQIAYASIQSRLLQVIDHLTKKSSTPESEASLQQDLAEMAGWYPGLKEHYQGLSTLSADQTAEKRKILDRIYHLFEETRQEFDKGARLKLWHQREQILATVKSDYETARLDFNTKAKQLDRAAWQQLKTEIRDLIAYSLAGEEKRKAILARRAEEMTPAP